MLSRNSYYYAGALVLFVAIGVVAWHWPDEVDLPPSEPGSVETPNARLADLNKRANSGDPNAEYELSRMYANGYGVPKSLQDEQKWLERAARHGNLQAQYEYGVAVRDGHGTVQDYEEAKKWMQLAAEGSNGPAQLALGNMYRTGLGIPIDNVKAYVWLNLAAAQGVPGAADARDTVLPRLTATELQEAQAEAKRLSALYLPKATPSR